MPYYPKQPTDDAGIPIQGSPTAHRAIASYGSTNQTTSSVITLNDNTRILEIAAPNGAVAMRFVGLTDTQASVISSGASANFDHIIPSGVTQRFAIPVETQGTSSVVGFNKQNGLFNRFAWIAAGANASVFGAEF